MMGKTSWDPALRPPRSTTTADIFTFPALSLALDFPLTRDLNDSH